MSDGPEDDLAAARGIVFGIGIALVAWFVVALLIWGWFTWR